MVLKKVALLFLCFAFSAYAYEADFHNFHYKINLTIQNDRNILEMFSDMISESAIVSEIKKMRIFSEEKKTVSNMRALKDKLLDSIEAMHKKAHTMGFYGAKIDHKIEIIDSQNVSIKINVNLGSKFKLKLNVHYLNQDDEFNRHYSSLLHNKLRKFKASIEEIKTFIDIAVKDLQKNGFFKPNIIEKRVHLDYEANEAILNLTIDPGQKVVFSQTHINSFPEIKDEFIKNRILWEEGEIFDIDKVESTAANLKNTQIFSKVKIKPDEEAVKDSKIPIMIEVQKNKKHTIDLSLLYAGMRNMNFEKKSQTQKRLKSIIARLSWTNCNVFGGGEKFNFIIEGTPMRASEKRSDYAFEIALSQPDVFLKNNTANYCVARKQELTNVFFKKSDQISLMLNYMLLNNLLVRFGGKIEKDYIDTSEVFFRNKDHRKNYDNFCMPLEFVLDKTDDLLNPTSGYRVTCKFSEIFFKHSTIGQLKTFDMNFSYNIALDELKRNVLAFNVSRKSIVGQKIDLIPVDKRIYCGGMNSVRGFANQMATEMVVGEDTPMGGKSAIEFNAEFRRRISPDFGGVLFFDGAKVFQNQSRYNDLRIEKKRWFYSTGIGIRYFTSIGPIRIDFAFPIRRRRGIDSKMQFIVSLGQAF